MLAPSVREAVELFAERVRQAFGRAVRQIVLFGSHARGEAHTDSDVDVAVVIDDMSSAIGRDVAGIAGDILTERDVLISAFAISTAHMEQLRARERLIARDIDREGIAL